MKITGTSDGQKNNFESHMAISGEFKSSPLASFVR